MDAGLKEVLDIFTVNGRKIYYYSLPKLKELGYDNIDRLPLTIRIILESLLRNFDNFTITGEHIKNLAEWRPMTSSTIEVPFKVARVIMQDFTGVPAIVDLATMRDVARELGRDPSVVNPLIPVDVIIDHSVQVDYWGSKDAFIKNLKLEFKRNWERYRFLKWAQQAFSNFRVFPPGLGIIHQVNLEYLAKVVMVDEFRDYDLAYFDTLVGTDSHTTMINGLGVLGWGVGGIEAEAAMLGEPITISTPKVVGVYLYGELREGVTATDLVLTLTEMLRKHNVVGKFVEFYGEGVKSLSVADRATVSNMAPEYGSTAALFPVDDETIRYLRLTGRPSDLINIVEKYYTLQNMFGVFKEDDLDFSEKLSLDLSTVEPSISGPSLPWQRLNFSEVPKSLKQLIEDRNKRRGMPSGSIAEASIRYNGKEYRLRDGDIVIAAITSCTNTSNPEVMIGSGILAKKAYEKGLRPKPYIKTSLAPGSRVVTEYLERSGLLRYLEELGFYIVGYGCTTCIGNSGPLPEPISKILSEQEILLSAVLSGNRNFEGRVHPDIRADYLMSPILVVAYAIAGTVFKDLSKDPLGYDKEGKPVYLKDIWPSKSEIDQYINKVITPEIFIEKYSNIEEQAPKEWKELKAPSGDTYEWDPKSTYIRKPPFFADFTLDRVPGLQDIYGARALLILGDSVTTDHISPAGRIKIDSPAGKYLLEMGVKPEEFNTYGARRGNHEVMIRGAFASKGVRNKMLKDVLGGYTVHHPSGEVMTVYDAAMRYKSEGVPLIIVAGKNYGAGSSRDWAAKAPKLLGVKAVIAESFERIHRSNLIGMGIVPLEFEDGYNADKLRLDGSETYDIIGLKDLKPRGEVTLIINRKDGSSTSIKLRARVDTWAELEYLKHGGILQYVLRKILRSSK